VTTYLNLNDTRALLGVDKHVRHFGMSSRDVGVGFAAMHDFSHQTYYYVANLLERGIKILNVSPRLIFSLMSRHHPDV
jgi:cathepsin A (carboxypeptidase C)